MLKNVMIPMQDGVRLATDIYLPKTVGKYPVIIIRTPYGKSFTLPTNTYIAHLFAGQGYAVMIQDVRGKYGSEGEFSPYAQEALDGHQTITWAGEAPWSNGKVALVGLSYPGSCAWLAARYNNPYLKTIVPMFTSHDTYSKWIEQGMPFLKGPLWWLCRFTVRTEKKKITPQHIENIMHQLPVNELDVEATGHKIPFYREFLTHLCPDPFWENLSLTQQIRNLNLPVLIIGGWYDPFIRGTVEDYQRMMNAPEGSKNTQCQLIVGPWSHDPTQEFADLKFEGNAKAHLIINPIFTWLEKWLKEDPKSLEKSTAPVRYFIMGMNVWKESKVWPPENTVSKKYYLTASESGKYRKNGGLSEEPSPDLYSMQYTYDPGHPDFIRNSYEAHDDIWTVPIDQTLLMGREDVLFYTSEPLERNLVIAGTIKLFLHISSDAVDTDFCAKICDMHPSGKVYNLAQGFARMRYRNSLNQQELIKPGAVYCLEIAFRPIACAFLKHHRIQLQVNSSNFPVHNRNLNTGHSNEFSAEITKAEQNVYSGGNYNSYLLLPTLDTG